jgi:hypothetical protein
MPVQIGRDEQSCYARWGDQGHKYYYKCGNSLARKNARKKAIAQGIVIGEYAIEKISFDFDFDDVLSMAPVREIAKRYIKQGVAVYIISARHNADTMYDVTDKLGIPRSRVYATGSNNAKIQKVQDLGITKHYDNNSDVINKLKGIGSLVKLSETYNDYPESVKNAAARGIRLNDEVNNKCATQVGKVRAQQLANGESISFKTIKRMYSYLSRAKEYYNPNDDKACGTISYLLWGGEPALKWSESKIKQINGNTSLNIHDRFAAVIKFISNDTSTIK